MDARVALRRERARWCFAVAVSRSGPEIAKHRRYLGLVSLCPAHFSVSPRQLVAAFGSPLVPQLCCVSQMQWPSLAAQLQWLRENTLQITQTTDIWAQCRFVWHSCRFVRHSWCACPNQLLNCPTNSFRFLGFWLWFFSQVPVVPGRPTEGRRGPPGGPRTPPGPGQKT